MSRIRNLTLCDNLNLHFQAPFCITSYLAIYNSSRLYVQSSGRWLGSLRSQSWASGSGWPSFLRRWHRGRMPFSDGGCPSFCLVTRWARQLPRSGPDGKAVAQAPSGLASPMLSDLFCPLTLFSFTSRTRIRVKCKIPSSSWWPSPIFPPWTLFPTSPWFGKLFFFFSSWLSWSPLCPSHSMLIIFPV